MTQYKIYQNDANTIAYINKGWSIIFIIAVCLLWGGFISSLPIIWNSLGLWTLMSNIYVYNPILAITLLVSLYLAYKINSLLITLRTQWLIKKGFIFTKEISACNAKQVASSLFYAYRFERQDMGIVGILGCGFIFLLFMVVMAMGAYNSLNKLITPSDIVQAKVIRTSDKPSRDGAIPSYYDLNIIYFYNGRSLHSQVVSLSRYEVGDIINLRCFKENTTMNKDIWNPVDEGLVMGSIMLFLYLITLLALMMVYHRKVYVIPPNENMAKL